MPTAQEIEDAKTPKGAWTRKTLEGWGVKWPPKKGWKDRLLAGQPEPVPPIDLAYSRINALGGTKDAHDDRIAGFLDAIDEALKILTDLGAKDAPYAALVADAAKK